MRIVHLCSELAPIAKVGGLADAVFSLAKAIASHGEEVEIILPKYDCIDYSPLRNLSIEMRELISYEGFHKIENTVWKADLGNLKIYFIEAHHPALYFSRGSIYGSKDDIDRFLYFTRASMEYLLKSKKKVDVLHLHDWPTAIGAVLQKDMYSALGIKNLRVVLTIHNMLHQGKCSPYHLSEIGLLGETYLTPEKMQDPLIPNCVNLLKGGMIYADAVTTVSPSYRKEIMTVEGGCGLHEEAKKIAHKLTGILNGIDLEMWNPATDSHLIERYESSCEHESGMQNILKARKENRRFLQKHLALEESDVPLIACISRLVPQKSPELIKESLLRTLELGGQFVLLGSHPPPEISEQFMSLRQQLQNNRNVAIWLDQDEALARLIYASSDLLVVPSLFEPCGLTQMIALRYGSVPVVRATGGLADTIFDIDNSYISVEKRNGFTFDYPDAQGIRYALDRAIKCLTEDQKRFRELQCRGLKSDFSWKHSALQYLDVYRSQLPSEAHV
jgi:starch synthase